ncbi:thioredoxin domain-containing protein [Carboxydocella sp. ULO1]|uniref:thioredoxin domain-containing protein n=1 Tax=Carboxydocella sp. ULO1 TaxID=1926599 RepID=UPI0009AE5481|nr:thioredoxin domain-containing protein [Carboxydocella sp. ULO1]
MANRLATEKSPYLLQHAQNPVDWYPWGEEAFQRAQKEDKPIFLSIGYSTCHWCHVMERESFEDEEVAEILNRYFVSIKVDREERPDVDQVYMTVCQVMTGQGGWPLTIIMTPEKKPFFAGTYFPKQSRHGMPGLVDILQRVAQLWQEEREQLLETGDRIVEAIRQEQPEGETEELKTATFEKAFQHFSRSFDPDYGGFGPPPKFPTPHIAGFLLRYWRLMGEEKALAMVEKTLEAMYLGGIYDHIGYGFSRYSTDRYWLVPHFEKMLYDNALLIYLYSEAYQCTSNPRYARIVTEIITYILREMTHPEGGFYSAQDADSEGEEGKYYVWQPGEVIKILGEGRGQAFCQAYDITVKGNFEGKNIPNLIKSGWVDGFEQEKERLYRHRLQRIPPYKDDKILTAWNGLMIAALAFAGRVWQKEEWTGAAAKAVQFIYCHLFREDGRLLARYREGEAQYPAYLDDYAFLTWGLLELYLTTLKSEYLQKAEKLAEETVDLFWDNTSGGCFFYGHDSEELFLRPKEVYDHALPAGNSVMAYNFWRLWAITGQERWRDLLDKQLKDFAPAVNRVPMAATFFLQVCWLEEQTPLEVTISGRPEEAEIKTLIYQLSRRFRPELVITIKPEDKPLTYMVCHKQACWPPVNNLEELLKMLAE